MISLILRTTTSFLLPLILLFSLFLLMRGHHEPGGGFAGGLVAAGAFSLYAIAFSAEAARKILTFNLAKLMGVGLLLAAGSGFISVFKNQPFLTSQWHTLHLGGLGELHLGTPLFFDIGVYLVVLAVVLTFIFSLMEES